MLNTPGDSKDNFKRIHKSNYCIEFRRDNSEIITFLPINLFYPNVSCFYQMKAWRNVAFSDVFFWVSEVFRVCRNKRWRNVAFSDVFFWVSEVFRVCRNKRRQKIEHVSSSKNKRCFVWEKSKLPTCKSRMVGWGVSLNNQRELGWNFL